MGRSPSLKNLENFHTLTPMSAREDLIDVCNFFFAISLMMEFGALFYIQQEIQNATAFKYMLFNRSLCGPRSRSTLRAKIKLLTILNVLLTVYRDIFL